MLYFKYVYVVIKAIVCVSDTLFTCLHWLRKERFRWFSEVHIPRALVLYMLWSRVKNGMIPSRWFSTSLAEKARCRKHCLCKASISVLNTEKSINYCRKAPDVGFLKKPFHSKNRSQVSPQLRFQWLVSVAYPEASFTVLQGSLMFLKHGHLTWLVADTYRVCRVP